MSEDLNFDVKNEPWNSYELEDGTIIKIKFVLLRVINEGLDPLGNPMIGTLINTIITSIPKKELRKITNIDSKIDMNILKTISEDWNIYNVKDGSLIKIKPNLSQINRTGKIDPRGEPIYAVIAQPSIKHIPKSR